MLPNDLNSETSYLKFKDSIKQWLEPKFIYFFFINFNHTTIHINYTTNTYKIYKIFKIYENYILHIK